MYNQQRMDCQTIGTLPSVMTVSFSASIDAVATAPGALSGGPRQRFRPALTVCLLAYGAGILCAPYFPFSLYLVFAPLPAAFSLIIPAPRPPKGLLLIFFFSALGLSLYHLSLQPPRHPSHVSHFTGQEVGLQGQIAAVFPGTDRTTVDLAAEQLFLPGRHLGIFGKVRIYVRQAADNLTPGDRLRIRCRLRPPSRFGTPGEFDHPRHLARMGIHAVTSLPGHSHLAPLPASHRVPLSIRIEKIRHFLREFINAAVPPDQASYLRAILIGDRSGFGREETERLSRLGVAHLFSVSGLHMGILFAVLYPPALFLIRRSETLLLRLGPPRRLLPLLLAPFLGFYLLLAGGGLPAQRAFWMILLGGALLFLYRHGNSLAVLATAAFGVLLGDPPALFSPSFQLSFVAVFAILLLTPPWLAKTAAWPGFVRYPMTLFLVTFWATSATFPLVLSHFHVASATGLVTNLFAVPVVAGIALPAAMTAAALSPFLPAAAAIPLQISGRLIEETLALGDAFARILPGTDRGFYTTPVQNLGIYLLLVLLLWQPWKRQRRKMAVAFTLLGICLLFLPPLKDDALTVTALSVGQGDAILVSIQGKHYLIDGGGLPAANLDIGERIVAPALARLGVRRLEAVVLTHAHPDHYLGLIHILGHFPVAEFWSAMEAEELPVPIREVLRRREIPMAVWPRGWHQTGPPSAIRIFVPDQQSSNINNRSLGFYCRYGQDSLLLTGDLEADGLRQLLETAPFNRATLVKLPHHGSFSSRLDALLATMNPELIFVSVGRNNPHGLPHRQAVAAATKRVGHLFRTDQDNTLRFHSEGMGWRALRWQRGLFR